MPPLADPADWRPPWWGALVPPEARTWWTAGLAVPQGSLTAFMAGGQARVRHQHRGSLVDWRQAIGWEARRLGLTPVAGAVRVALAFRMPRPASAPVRRRTWPATRPDLDKLTRAVLDALTGVVLVDDAQVVTLVVDEDYGSPTGVLVAVWSVEAQVELGAVAGGGR